MKRHEAGANSVYDVTRAQALVAQVRSSIPELQGQRRALLFELTALLGRTPAEAPNDLETCVTPPRLVALIPVGDGSALIKRRPDVRQAERRLAVATAEIGVATADLYPTIRLVGLYGGAATELSQLNTNIGLTWGVGPAISWSFPNRPHRVPGSVKPRPGKRLRWHRSTASCSPRSRRPSRRSALYSAALDNREALGDAQTKIHESFDIAHDGVRGRLAEHLDLLTTEQSLVALDAAVASSDAALIQDQIAVFKALGGGWQIL